MKLAQVTILNALRAAGRSLSKGELSDVCRAFEDRLWKRALQALAARGAIRATNRGWYRLAS